MCRADRMYEWINLRLYTFYYVHTLWITKFSSLFLILQFAKEYRRMLNSSWSHWTIPIAITWETEREFPDRSAYLLDCPTPISIASMGSLIQRILMMMAAHTIHPTRTSHLSHGAASIVSLKVRYRLGDDVLERELAEWKDLKPSASYYPNPMSSVCNCKRRSPHQRPLHKS